MREIEKPRFELSAYTPRRDRKAKIRALCLHSSKFTIVSTSPELDKEANPNWSHRTPRRFDLLKELDEKSQSRSKPSKQSSKRGQIKKPEASWTSNLAEAVPRQGTSIGNDPLNF